jgi:hypothetical protein
MIHAIQTDGRIERFDGERMDALEHVEALIEHGRNADIALSADSESEYAKQLQAHRERTSTKSIK